MRMRRRGVRSLPPLVLWPLALSLSSCGATQAAAPSHLFFPTVPRLNAYPAALMTGVLQEESNCLFVRSGDERWLLLWPEGYAARVGEGRSIQVFDDDGRLVAATGQRISVGGGETNPVEVGGAAAADDRARELTGREIPHACRSLYWLVSP